MVYNSHQFRNLLKGYTDMVDIVEVADQWKALLYAKEQGDLIDAMPEEQLRVVHTLTTHPDTEKAPMVFCWMDPKTENAVLREDNGMKLFVTPAGDCQETFYN